MDVQLFVPHGTEISVIRAEYGDIEQDRNEADGDTYWIGASMDEKGNELDSADEWMTMADAVVFCGFCEGAIPEAQTLIEGNGGWAQGMISRRDFSDLAMSAEGKLSCKRISNRYWKAHRLGGKKTKEANHEKRLH